ncbi:MAG: putative Ig domain-containing protein [Candidatus Riflebacteria bacterium]|nr:putative Ig domain-containing protein [Candidatus Riflebacteria bacterium]
MTQTKKTNNPPGLFRAFRCLLIFLVLLVTSLISGCMGGSNSGNLANSINSTDSEKIIATLNKFNANTSQRNSAEAENLLSAKLKSQNGSGKISGLFQIWDFGNNFKTQEGSASYTFVIPSDGITQPSSNYAEVFSYYTSPGGNRIEIVFQVTKDIDGEWFIDDFRINSRSIGVFQMQPFFPLDIGDRWKYTVEQNNQQLPYYIVITVASGPDTINGKKVYTLNESFEPLNSISSFTIDPKIGRFSRYGGYWRFSNDSGIWDFGPPPLGTYTFNAGQPLKMWNEVETIGTYTEVNFSEVYQNTNYSGYIDTSMSELFSNPSAFGIIDTLPSYQEWYYQNKPDPWGRSHIRKTFYFKEGLGLAFYLEMDQISGEIWQIWRIVEAKVAGKEMNPADWPFQIISSPFLPDAYPNSPYHFEFEAQWGFASNHVWTVTSGSLPPGLFLSPSGILEGTPIEEGNYKFSLKVSEKIGSKTASQDFSITIKQGMVILDNVDLPRARINQNYDYGFKAQSGGEIVTENLSWILATYTTLPPGLSLASGTGIISGIPTQTGIFYFQLEASDSLPKTHSFKSFSLQVAPEISGTLKTTATWMGGGFMCAQIQFLNDRNQPVFPDSQTLSTSSITLIDLQVSKSGDSSSSAGVHPYRIDYTGEKDPFVYFEYGQGDFDYNSTTLSVIASGVLSSSLNMISSSTPVTLRNRMLFREFIPWSAFATPGTETVPFEIKNFSALNPNLFFVYRDGVEQFNVTVDKTGPEALLKISRTPVAKWFTDQKKLYIKDFSVFKTTGTDDLNCWVLSTVGTSSSIISQFAPTASSTFNSMDGFMESIPQHMDFLNHFKVFAPSGKQTETILWADDSYLKALLLTGEVNPNAGYPTKVVDMVATGSPGVFPQIRTIDEGGNIRKFSMDQYGSITGGEILFSLPNVVANPNNEFKLCWYPNSDPLEFLLVTDKGNNRAVLVTGSGVNWQIGGNTGLKNIKGRLNAPLGQCEFALEDTTWSVVADADGIQVFEHYGFGE